MFNMQLPECKLFNAPSNNFISSKQSPQTILLVFPRNSGHTERLGLEYNHITMEV